MSQALLAIQNILQNSNIFNGSRETVLFMPFSDKKVTQFSGFLPTAVSYLNVPEWNFASNLWLLLTTGGSPLDDYAKDGNQERSDIYVVFTMILCDLNFCVK